MPVDRNLKGIIGIGFDENLDYSEEEMGSKPEIVIFYINDEFCSDINLYSSKDWRGALNEFFDISRFTK